MKRDERKVWAFKPTPKNWERIRYAIRLRLNASEIVNTILEVHLRSALEKERQETAKELREALSAPVP